MKTTDICLVLFCRRPAPGEGKQRLAAGIGRETAAAAAELLLAAAVEDLNDWPGPVAVAPARDSDHEWASTLLARPGEILGQGNGNLGARLNAVDRELRRRGAQRLIFIGSDAPELSPGDYAAARAALDTADVVIGPALDGGVTLMGANAPWPALDALPWSTNQLGTALATLCKQHGRRVDHLEPGADVDVAADLERAGQALGSDTRPARQRLVQWWQTDGRLTMAQRNGPSAGLSVIIPVLGDTPAMERLAGLLAGMPEPPDEIIAVDGANDPACRETCAGRGVRYVATAAGRGLQLDAGARAATGKWLWFLHADATPPTTAAQCIRDALARGQVGGWFRFRFDGAEHALARALAALINWRCRFGTPYGDQGLFMTADAYHAAGGFPSDPLFEEVPLVRGLRRLGSFEPLPLSIGVSPRRWERDGWLRRTFMNRQLALAYMLGVSPARLARRYHAPVEDGGA